jgi:hypothetical protein
MVGGIIELPLNLKTANTMEITRKMRAQKNIENS